MGCWCLFSFEFHPAKFLENKRAFRGVVFVNGTLGKVKMAIGDLLDRQLVKRILKGDEKAADVLVRRYQARAFQVARAVLLEDEAARDAVQDAFLRMIASLRSYDHGQPFWPWFRRIVVNTSLNAAREQVRRRLREQQCAEEDSARAGQDEDPAERADFRAAVERALEKLSPELRAVFALRVQQDLSYREIADVLGVPVGTVMSRLAKVRSFLRSELKDYVNVR